MARRNPKIDTNGKPWARYLRLSKAEAINDPTKTKAERLALTNAKLDAHLDEVTAWMDANGIPYSDEHVYRDPGLSAWKRGVVRPEWDAMMVAAEAGDLAGIGIVAVDRFTRDVTTMEDLIRLAETASVKIGGPRAGSLDLTTYQGIQQARGMAMQAANESLATSFRLRETLGRKMRAGQPMGGGRSFGFETGGMIQRPDEVAVIREMAERVLDGEPLQHLASELNERGLSTTRGGEWTGANLGRMLGLARYGGEVEHHGEIVGTIPGEPVLDRDTYDNVRGLLASRRRGRRPTAPYLLTGILMCSDCKKTMNGGSTYARSDGSRPRVYKCARTKQGYGCGRSIMAEPVEEFVGAKMIEMMADPANAARIAEEEEQLSEARRSKQAKVDAIEEQLVALEDKWAAGELIGAAYDRAKARLDDRYAKAKAALAEVAPVVRRKGKAAAEVRAKTTAARVKKAREDWEVLAATPEAQRHLIREYRLRPVVLPKPPTGRDGAPKDRVRFLTETR